MRKPISDGELAQAVSCHLIDADGTRWEVLEVTLADGRAWVRARSEHRTNGRPERDGPEHGSDDLGSNGHGDLRVRVFDTVITAGARLVWRLPDGKTVMVRGDGEGGLHWKTEGGAEVVDEVSSGNGDGRFFEDAFFHG